MSEPLSEEPLSDVPAPGDDVFSEADIRPDRQQRRSLRRGMLDKIAATVAVCALGLWIGGWVALGACAAPFVFQLPHPLGATTMGAVFQRFDSIAIVCAIVVLGCEVARTVLTCPELPQLAPRIRRVSSVLLAAAAVYSAVSLSPGIMELHRQGVRRKVGPQGAQLQHLHTQAELIAKGTVPGGVLVIVLHMLTLHPSSRQEDEEG